MIRKQLVLCSTNSVCVICANLSCSYWRRMPRLVGGLTRAPRVPSIAHEPRVIKNRRRRAQGRWVASQDFQRERL